jgi:hypothetical protein
MTKGPFCESTSNTQLSFGLQYWGGKFERRLTTKYLTRQNPKPKKRKTRMNRALFTSAAAALLLGGSMISAPTVLAHHRLTPYHSHIHRIVSPTPDSLILNASFENGLTDWNNRYGNTSLVTSGQRSGTGALQVTAGSAEYQDVSARVQPGHTYRLTGYMKVLNSEAVPNAGMGVQDWDSSSNLQINTVSELAAYSTGYQQVSTTFTVPTGVTTARVIAEDWDNSYSQLVDTSGPTTQPSASGTTISTATQIVDSAGHIWTVKSGVVDENGTAAGTTSGVTTLLYWNGKVYQQTSAGWWSWNGSAWVTASDPRGPASTGSTGDTGSTGGTTVLSGDWATYNISNGPYWAYNSIWNKGGLVNGKDFTQSLTLDNANFPNGSVLAWSWPNTPAQNNVYSSPCLMFGTYAQVAAPTPTIPYKQINAINTLTVTHNVTLSSDPTKFDAIYDFYLQSSTDTSTQGLFEIELHMHTPEYFIDWINHSLTKYNFTDAAGTNWIIAWNRGVSSPMIIFVRADFADNLNATVDLKALLMAAKANGLLTGNEYFTGLAMAVEPREGSGSMTINSLSVTYN